MGDNNFSRRKFLTGASVLGAAGVVGINPLISCSSGDGGKSVLWFPVFLSRA